MSLKEVISWCLKDWWCLKDQLITVLSALKLPWCNSELPWTGSSVVQLGWCQCGSQFGDWVFLANRHEPVHTITAPDNITKEVMVGLVTTCIQFYLATTLEVFGDGFITTSAVSVWCRRHHPCVDERWGWGGGVIVSSQRRHVWHLYDVITGLSHPQRDGMGGGHPRLQTIWHWELWL